MFGITYIIRYKQPNHSPVHVAFIMQGYNAEIHWEVEAETKKQERLHMAMATGVL